MLYQKFLQIILPITQYLDRCRFETFKWLNKPANRGFYLD